MVDALEQMKTFDQNGVTVFEVPAEGPLLGSERDATDLIGEAYGVEFALFAIPVERLAPDFLQLRTKMAGLFIQKFVNYGVRVAFVGDVDAALAASDALAAFVAESNRGTSVWFVRDIPELKQRLG